MTKIWKMSIDITLLNERGKNTMAEHLDIKFIEFGMDFLKATMPVDHKTNQPVALNGGASCALAKTVASTAANYCVDQPLQYCVGLDINANHISPARKGLVTATAKPFHLGKQTQVWEIQIHSDTNRLVCISRMTMAVLEK